MNDFCPNKKFTFMFTWKALACDLYDFLENYLK